MDLILQNHPFALHHNSSFLDNSIQYILMTFVIYWLVGVSKILFSMFSNSASFADRKIAESMQEGVVGTRLNLDFGESIGSVSTGRGSPIINIDVSASAVPALRRWMTFCGWKEINPAPLHALLMARIFLHLMVELNERNVVEEEQLRYWSPYRT